MYDYIMTLNEEDRGPTYTRMALTSWEVPSGSAMLNGDYWAVKGQALSGSVNVHTSIMDADEEYRAGEFTRLWTFNWELGFRNTHYGDKAFQLGCTVDCQYGQEYYDWI